MQITLTHNSELRLRKVDALHRVAGVSYPVSGDNHYPSIGEEVEVAKHYRLPTYAESLTNLFRHTQKHEDLTKAVDALETQDTLF